MIILEKKRILTTLGIVFASLFMFSIQTTNVKMKTDAIETVALPVSNKVIVIDAGHGIPDEGAQSSARNNRSSNKFENSIETTKFIRTSRKHSNINKK